MFACLWLCWYIRFEACWPAIAQDAMGVIFVYNPDQPHHDEELEKWSVHVSTHSDYCCTSSLPPSLLCPNSKCGLLLIKHLHVHTHACMRAHSHTCMYACAHTPIHACMHTCTYTCMHTHTHTHTLHTCMHAPAPPYMYTCTHTHMHKPMHACMQVHTCMHT